MEPRVMLSRDVDGAREEIFKIIQDDRDKKVIYFDGWSGFGASSVLRSIAHTLPSIKAKKTPPELCYDRIIYIDCSEWISRREMQRKIAKELKLDHDTIAMFDKQDEEDDFNGVDRSSRDVIRRVSQVIGQILGSVNFFMIFLNGSNDEVDVNRFGISPDFRDHVIVWTFNRRSLTVRHWHARDEREGELRYTHLFLANYDVKVGDLTTSEFSALLRQEAAIMVARNSCMRDISLTVVTDCCRYGLFLHYCFHGTTRFYWQLNHASSYWVCDGIIKGDRTWETSNALHQEICWECDASLLGDVFEKLKEDPDALFLVFKGDIAYGKGPFRWISVNSENLEIQEHMQTIFEKASTLFVEFERYNNPQGLPNGVFQHCSNLGVLTLCCCVFSFVSPPFLRCPRLRFLGLDHCTNDNTDEGDNCTKWACLYSLWVLDIRYTDWDEILTEEKMDLMTNLRELNIEGVYCWQYTSGLQGRLSYLQRLRIIKPTRQAETSIDSTNNSFIDKTKLEILDLSGNRDMKNLPASLSKASSLQVLILDGCDGLENVVVPGRPPSSLRSFSFDGYGPALHWTSTVELPAESSRPKGSSDANKKDIVKTSKISLEGCTELENLFVRGLPNLVELDLSGTAIKVLDFGTMVVNVPGLKRFFLLGCEHLRAIRWSPYSSTKLDLLCLDTRPRRTPGFTRPSLAQHGSFGFQLHAILADARLARSLWLPLWGQPKGCAYFNIHVTSPSTEYGGVVQLEGTKEEMIGPSNQMHHVRTSRYGDVYTEIGDAPMLAFPQHPAQQLDHHIEISDGSRGIESELEYSPPRFNLADIVRRYAESLHVHDASISAGMPVAFLRRLRWCRVERCPNMDTVFPSGGGETNDLETIWASDLQMARCIWSKGSRSPSSFRNLQHLHLRSCPSLQFVLPVWVSSFPSLKTLHIIHCVDLMHVFVLDEVYPEEIAVQGVPFPKLTTIHLHDLPKLRQINELKMLAPALETIKIRGCFGLRRLPALGGREPGVKKPAVEMEKDVWDKLEWDGVDAGHHPDLFEPLVHSRYYRRRHLRGTVLR